MELPRKRSKPTSSNPKLLVLFGKPKSGKTTALAALDDNLIVDAENGSNYVESMSVKVNCIKDIKEVHKAIKEAGNPYKYITFDTVTSLEEIALELALDDYRKTPMGKKFGLNPETGKYSHMDIRTLPNGGGYLYIRNAFQKIVNMFRGLTEHLILVGHTKDKNINKDGKELSENSIDLSGKLERIISSQADALGYVYRSKNKTIINFNGGGDFIVEARPDHLRGKEIVIAETDEDGKFTFHWDQIFE